MEKAGSVTYVLILLPDITQNKGLELSPVSTTRVNGPSWRVTDFTLLPNHRHNLQGCEGTGTPLFGLRGTVLPLSGRKCEKFAVTRSDLQRLNYNKSGPHWESSRRYPRPRFGWEGVTSSPFSSPLVSWPSDT